MEDYNNVSYRVGYSSGALTGKTVEEYFSKAKTSSYLFDIAAYLDIVVVLGWPNGLKERCLCCCFKKKNVR